MRAYVHRVFYTLREMPLHIVLTILINDNKHTNNNNNPISIQLNIDLILCTMNYVIQFHSDLLVVVVAPHFPKKKKRLN